MGGTYGSSTFIALLGLVAGDDALRPGDRIGIFSYGSGSCAELWSARGLAPKRGRRSQEAGLPALLDARRRVSVAEYEIRLKRARVEAIDRGDFCDQTGDASFKAGTNRYYRDKGLLIFKGMQEYYRQYAWSWKSGPFHACSSERLDRPSVEALRAQLAAPERRRRHRPAGIADGRFCLGMDFGSAAASRTRQPSAATRRDLQLFAGFLHDFLTAPRPTLALVDGPALGGGLGIARGL